MLLLTMINQHRIMLSCSRFVRAYYTHIKGTVQTKNANSVITLSPPRWWKVRWSFTVQKNIPGASQINSVAATKVDGDFFFKCKKTT